MVPALTSLLPFPVPVHHLGLYREKTTLQPVEYYNNLPYHSQAPPSTSTPNPLNPSHHAAGPAELAIIVDPIIATGATACAAIETLRDWGVKRIIVCAVLGSEAGLRKAAEESEGVEIWVGGCDGGVDERGMIRPGLGDVGDRLYLTIGK
jgi:uracil phosphoribosyltransferase